MRSPFPPPHGVWSRPRFLFCLVFVSAPPYMCYDLVGVSGHQDTLNFGFSLSGARSLGRAVTAQHSPDFIIHMIVSIIRIIYEYSHTYIYIYILPIVQCLHLLSWAVHVPALCEYLYTYIYICLCTCSCYHTLYSSIAGCKWLHSYIRIFISLGLHWVCFADLGWMFRPSTFM